MKLATSQTRFRLSRFYAASSLLGILVVTAALLYTYRLVSEQNLIQHEGRANADLTRAVANAIWQRFPEVLTTHPANRTQAELLADPQFNEIHDSVVSKLRGLSVVKVKFYDPQGLTLYSTDRKQVGERKPGNPGLVGALAGEVVSQLGYRERFDAFEGQIKGRNIIATYVPVRTHDGGPIEGVAELYSDVTPLLEHAARDRWVVAASFFGLLTLLYFFLAGVVLKADRIIRRQEADREAREEQAIQQAHHDALTGLPNRAYFNRSLAQFIEQAQQADAPFALLFVDLDRFKVINDSRGHQIGDGLLVEVAARLKGLLGPQDRTFRMGGDEFTVLLAGADATRAAAIADRLIAGVAKPYGCLGPRVSIGASIGLACFPADGDSPDVLLRNADAAMYSAKATGRGSLVRYHSELNHQASERLDLEVALQRAIRHEEFVVYYQPRLDAASRRVVALEALLRWARPGHGLVAPNDFIPVLEDCGMMPVVGEWVLRRACEQLRRWQEGGWSQCRISVNVSASQFRNDNLVDTVASVLRETGVAPALIELELTESMLLNDHEQARTTVEALRRL